MQIILLEDVKNIGKKGDVKTVNDGYAVNFLIPRKLAVKLTEKSQEILDKQNQDKKEQIEKDRQLAIENRDKINSIVLEFKAKAAPDGRMLGTISNKQVEEELKNKYNIVIDKRKILDKYQINAFGTTKLKIELFKEVIATINVHVSEDK